jgi:hypothetical protein
VVNSNKIMRKKHFEPIKELFWDSFQEETKKINTDFDFVNCRALFFFPPDDFPEGVSNFTMYIDCGFLQAGMDGTDFLDLIFSVYDFNKELTINAEISWGMPYNKVELELFDEAVPATEENLKIIEEKLPGMVEKFRELIRDNPKGK